MKNFSYKYHILFFVLILTISSCSTNSIVENGVNDDPFEQTNRNIFEFNNSLDDYFFKPVARGWRKLPSFPKNNLANMAETAYAPLSLANAILQFDTEGASIIIRRLFINLTFGLAGMYDVASTKEFGSIEKREEDFGQTLAVYGFSEGPFVMLPIFGPSNVRDSFGRLVDTVFNPVSFAFRMQNIGLEGRLSQPVISGVDKRETYLDYMEEIEESSLDYYATIKSLYSQKRKKDIRNGKGKLESKINYELEENWDVSDDQIIDNPTKAFLKPIENKKIDYNDELPSSNHPDFNEETKYLTN